MEFSREEYWSGLPSPSPGDFPNPVIEHGSPSLQADTLPSEPPGKPRFICLLKTLMLEMLILEVKEPWAKETCFRRSRWHLYRYWLNTLCCISKRSVGTDVMWAVYKNWGLSLHGVCHLIVEWVQKSECPLRESQGVVIASCEDCLERERVKGVLKDTLDVTSWSIPGWRRALWESIG